MTLRLLLCWLLSFPAALAAGAPDPATIVELIAATPGERRAFTEERFNSLLSEPMSLQGYVTMTEDGTLRRVVEAPFEESATIDGEQATVTRDGLVRRLDLDRRGPGGAYLRALYALLQGDAPALETLFELTVTEDADAWRLTLVPRDRTLARRLDNIAVTGSGDRVERIRMERSDGAWQDMRLLPAPP